MPHCAGSITTGAGGSADRRRHRPRGHPGVDRAQPVRTGRVVGATVPRLAVGVLRLGRAGAADRDQSGHHHPSAQRPRGADRDPPVRRGRAGVLPPGGHGPRPATRRHPPHRRLDRASLVRAPRGRGSATSSVVPMPVLLVSRAAPEGIEAKVTKSGKSRRVPIADRVLPLVRACADGKGPDDLLFTTRGGHQLHATSVKRAVHWTAVAPGRRIHDLRHTAACLWLARGRRPGDGAGVARARVDRHHEHLPAPPRLVRGPGRTGPPERAGGRRGCARDQDRGMTPRSATPLRRSRR